MAVASTESVVDIGCGNGLLLSVFMESGIEDVLGVDLPGNDPKLLKIPPERFVTHDLSTPFAADRKFDLVISLEVAEHLEADSAETFVDTLTGLGPLIVFSAAVPWQGGYEHLNEQWQDWWAEKFQARGYVAIDCIRDKLWSDTSIPLYYRQNTIMYAREELLNDNLILQRAHARTEKDALSRIHPEFYLMRADPKRATARFVLNALLHLPRALARAIAIRLWERIR